MLMIVMIMKIFLKKGKKMNKKNKSMIKFRNLKTKKRKIINQLNSKKKLTMILKKKWMLMIYNMKMIFMMNMNKKK